MSFPLLSFSLGSETLKHLPAPGFKVTDPRRGLRGKGTESSLLLGADCAWTRVTVALMIPNCRALLTWLFCECSDGFSLFSPGRPWPAPQQLCPPAQPTLPTPPPRRYPPLPLCGSQPPPLVAASPKGLALPVTCEKHLQG